MFCLYRFHVPMHVRVRMDVGPAGSCGHLHRQTDRHTYIQTDWAVWIQARARVGGGGGGGGEDAAAPVVRAYDGHGNRCCCCCSYSGKT